MCQCVKPLAEEGSGPSKHLQIAAWLAAWRPPNCLTCSEWADKMLVLRWSIISRFGISLVFQYVSMMKTRAEACAIRGTCRGSLSFVRATNRCTMHLLQHHRIQGWNYIRKAASCTLSWSCARARCRVRSRQPSLAALWSRVCHIKTILRMCLTACWSKRTGLTWWRCRETGWY